MSTVAALSSPSLSGTGDPWKDGTNGLGGSPKNTSCGEYPTLRDTVAFIDAATQGNNYYHETPSPSNSERRSKVLTALTIRSAFPLVQGVTARVLMCSIPSSRNNAAK